MTVQLALFYDAFLDAVVGGDPRALGMCLEDRSAADNALVYRNTVFRGAADALSTAYPAVARLAGSAYFESVAIAYVSAEPPLRRSLVGYGETFPEFLEAAPGIDQAPYMPDAARLDRAWLGAHRAADANALAAPELTAVPPDRLTDLGLRLHPSVRIVELGWTVHEAWKANRDVAGREKEAREVCRGRQSVLLWRAGHEVASQTLTPAEAAFFGALQEKRPLGAAAAEALTISEHFNTSLVFAGALEAGVFDASQPELDQKREEWW